MSLMCYKYGLLETGASTFWGGLTHFENICGYFEGMGKEIRRDTLRCISDYSDLGRTGKTTVDFADLCRCF